MIGKIASGYMMIVVCMINSLRLFNRFLSKRFFVGALLRFAQIYFDLMFLGIYEKKRRGI